MKKVIEKNGYIELHEYETIPWWVTRGTYSDYFLLNQVTAKLFSESNLLDANTIISKELYYKIFNYTGLSVNKNNTTQSFLFPQHVKLKEHQIKAINIMLDTPRFGLFLGTGTGKTYIAIGFLINKLPNVTIVITPKRVIDQYANEVKTLASSFDVHTNFKSFKESTNNNKILITNYEQIKTIASLGIKIDCLILDESHRAKDYTSNINEELRKITPKIKYVYLFTGTPQDSSRHNIFPQIALLHPEYMPTKSKFLDRYFELDDYFQPIYELSKLSDELTSMIEEYTWGQQAEDVIELTQENEYVIECDHPTFAYDELLKHRIIQIKGIDIIADNKGVLKNKLRQIASGSIILKEQDEAVLLPNKKSKYLYETLTKNNINNGIIYSFFKADTKIITKVLDFLNKKYFIIDGSVKEKDSSNALKEFKSGKIDFMVMQAQSGNAGLDLSNVNNIIFYTLPDSYIVFKQCKARIRRIGQTKECNYFYLLSKDTVDYQVYKALKSKKNFTDKLFRIYDTP